MQNAQFKKYKIITVMRPTFTSDKALEIVNDLLKLDDTKKIENQTVNMHSLSYKMDKNSQGHFIVTDAVLNIDNMQKIRKEMEIDESFLRIMFLANDPKSETNNFQIKDEFIKSMAFYTSKRGSIKFGSKALPRKQKVKISGTIKRLRYLGLLPYCNYDI